MFLPGPAWLLLNKIYTPFNRSLYVWTHNVDPLIQYVDEVFNVSMKLIDDTLEAQTITVPGPSPFAFAFPQLVDPIPPPPPLSLTRKMTW